MEVKYNFKQFEELFYKKLNMTKDDLYIFCYQINNKNSFVTMLGKESFQIIDIKDINIDINLNDMYVAIRSKPEFFERSKNIIFMTGIYYNKADETILSDNESIDYFFNKVKEMIMEILIGERK